MMKKALVLFFVLSMSFSAFAAEGDIKLPEPEKSGGISILDAIANRQSARDFEDVELSEQQLSTLLWAAAGVNRDDGKLTYATASNLQDIILFVFTKSGTYRYNPSEHSLTLVAKGDNRAETGGQPFVAKAAVDLVYVQDASKWVNPNRQTPPSVVANCGFAHVGFSMQNVYLYATSQGWGARTRMSFDRVKLSKLLGLEKDQSLVLMQCVGPKP